MQSAHGAAQRSGEVSLVGMAEQIVVLEHHLREGQQQAAAKDARIAELLDESAAGLAARAHIEAQTAAAHEQAEFQRQRADGLENELAAVAARANAAEAALAKLDVKGTDASEFEVYGQKPPAASQSMEGTASAAKKV